MKKFEAKVEIKVNGDDYPEFIDDIIHVLERYFQIKPIVSKEYYPLDGTYSTFQVTDWRKTEND